MTEWEELLQTMKNSVIEKSTSATDEICREKQTTTTTDSGIKCSKCGGSGWVLIVDNGIEYAKECECGIRQREIHDNRLRFANIPETYKGITLKDIRTNFYTKQESKNQFKAIAESVKWFIDHLDDQLTTGKGFYFWSETKGSGKTMLAVAIANELINNHKKMVKFSTSLDILDAIRATYDSKEDSESKLLTDLTNADILIIDDFGTERATDWAGEKFYQIVNNRYINKKVTFYTSNCNLKTLKYDDRITNRIRERSYLVHFPEESVREYKARTENRSVE